MAGRGRSATLPAWMLNETYSSEASTKDNSSSSPRATSEQEPTRLNRGRSKSPEKRSRCLQCNYEFLCIFFDSQFLVIRSRDRERNRNPGTRRHSRSRSSSPEVNWTLRRANRVY